MWSKPTVDTTTTLYLRKFVSGYFYDSSCSLQIPTNLPCKHYDPPPFMFTTSRVVLQAVWHRLTSPVSTQMTQVVCSKWVCVYLQYLSAIVLPFRATKTYSVQREVICNKVEFTWLPTAIILYACSVFFLFYITQLFSKSPGGWLYARSTLSHYLAREWKEQFLYNISHCCQKLSSY